MVLLTQPFPAWNLCGVPVEPVCNNTSRFSAVAYQLLDSPTYVAAEAVPHLPPFGFHMLPKTMVTSQGSRAPVVRMWKPGLIFWLQSSST